MKERKSCIPSFRSVSQLFRKYQITLIRDRSTRAVAQFKAKSIDFVYVDARHDDCGFSADLEAYYPILRCGGLFTGHDFELEYNGTEKCAETGTGVKQEFAQKNKIELVQQTGEKLHKSWYFFKECYTSDKVLRKRSKIYDLLNEFNYKTMVEIGVREGDLAKKLLQKWPHFEHYYGIDPYEKQVNYIDGSNVEQAEQDSLYSQVLNFLVSK
jgi:hypothetical protein